MPNVLVEELQALYESTRRFRNEQSEKLVLRTVQHLPGKLRSSVWDFIHHDGSCA